MGELHLEIIKDRILREYNISANAGKPMVAYRESVSNQGYGKLYLTVKLEESDILQESN